MKHYILLAITGILLLTSCSGSKKTKVDIIGVDFSKSKTLSPLLDEAATKNKLVFIDFYTSWCLPCQMMDDDVFSDRNIADFMNQNFINYKVDAEKENGPLLALVYEVQAYPTMVFVNSKGDVLVKKVGAAYQTELMNLAKEALAMTETLQ